MSIWVILKIALKALNRNKIRSVLTMLGIIIGVGAVIAMVSLGKGAQRQVQEEIASMGTNTLQVWTGSMRSFGNWPPNRVSPKCFAHQEIQELRV